MKKFELLILILALSAPGFCQSISISNSPAGGTWSVSTLSSNVTSAGTNYTHIEESSASHTLLKVTALLLYSVSVHQSVASNWDSALLLSVKRTGNGTGSGRLQTAPTTFCSPHLPRHSLQAAWGWD